MRASIQTITAGAIMYATIVSDSVHAALLFTTASVVIEDVVSVFEESRGSVTAEVVVESELLVISELVIMVILSVVGTLAKMSGWKREFF